MHEHIDAVALAAFVYGPFAFIALSFAGSVPLAKRLARRFGRSRPTDETFWQRPALGERAISLLAALSLIWTIATVVGMGLLAIPDPRGPATRLRIDAALVAHAIPPISKRAAEQIADELRRGEGITRFQPVGEMESRMVAASHVDPRPERSIAELAARGFRTHAGRFALGTRSLAACEPGLDALAEALQGSALQELMRVCRNAPGDAVARAAFKMGDFSRSVGHEAESIVSRQPRSPRSEPSCFAGGYEVPPASQPICRLLHAEIIAKTREAIHADPVRAPRFAELWWEAARLVPGQAPPAHVRFTIDPELLVRRPRAALRDQPIALYTEMLRRETGTLQPIGQAWVRLAVAASASQAGDRHDAAKGVSNALADIESAGADDPQRVAALRLALAVSIRAGFPDHVERTAKLLAPDDPLVVRARFARGADAATEPEWVRLVAVGANAVGIADALHAVPELPEDLGRLSAVRHEDREALREWLRDDFPVCDACGFAAQLDRLTLRLDAAHALGDRPLVDALDAVYRRYDAVMMNRLLALSLRAADTP
jgi:hypothetical protein